jgi:hypothetical protein
MSAKVYVNSTDVNAFCRIHVENLQDAKPITADELEGMLKILADLK